MKRFLLTVSASLLLGGLAGCSENAQAPANPAPAKVNAPSSTPKPQTAPPKAEANEQDLVARGRSVYLSNCTACHSPDPAQDGAIGPANAGSSEALLEAKVIHNTYPPGYKPKRDSNAMMALPHLEKDIPALHAYLNSVAR